MDKKKMGRRVRGRQKMGCPENVNTDTQTLTRRHRKRGHGKRRKWKTQKMGKAAKLQQYLPYSNLLYRCECFTRK